MSTHKIYRYIVGMLIIMTMSGCATSRGYYIKDSQLDKLQEGISTKKDVISLIGKPEKVEVTSEGKEKLIYSSKAKGHRFSPIYIIPVVGPAKLVGDMVAESKVANQIVIFLFNIDGVLEKVSVTETEGGLSYGEDSSNQATQMALMGHQNIQQQNMSRR